MKFEAKSQMPQEEWPGSFKGFSCLSSWLEEEVEEEEGEEEERCFEMEGRERKYSRLDSGRPKAFRLTMASTRNLLIFSYQSL